MQLVRKIHTYLYVLTLCWVASGKPSIPHTTRLLLRLQPLSQTCLHLPACFTSTTPSVIRLFFFVDMRMGRRRTSSIRTLLCLLGNTNVTTVTYFSTNNAVISQTLTVVPDSGGDDGAFGTWEPHMDVHFHNIHTLVARGCPQAPAIEVQYYH